MQATGWTGGENGLRGIRLTSIGPLDFVDPTTRYYVVAVMVIAALFVLSRILASPFGAVLEAVRENEARALACGFDVRATRFIAFTLSGAFCGLAGGLQALHLGIVPLETAQLSDVGPGGDDGAAGRHGDVLRAVHRRRACSCCWRTSFRSTRCIGN